MTADKRPSRKRPPALPMPTMFERASAAEAARTLLRALNEASTMGTPSTVHLDYSRPRRAEWVTTWSELPEFTRIVDSRGTAYTHALLPGWQYTRHELRSEMVSDLELLAERGLRPTQSTGCAA